MKKDPRNVTLKLAGIFKLLTIALLIPLRTQSSELRYTWDSNNEGFNSYSLDWANIDGAWKGTEGYPIRSRQFSEITGLGTADSLAALESFLSAGEASLNELIVKIDVFKQSYVGWVPSLDEPLPPFADDGEYYFIPSFVQVQFVHAGVQYCFGRYLNGENGWQRDLVLPFLGTRTSRTYGPFTYGVPTFSNLEVVLRTYESQYTSTPFSWGIDNLVIYGTSPSIPIDCPSAIVTSTDLGQCSAVVNFNVTSSSPGATVICDPPSGSSFPSGTTLVNCTASDGQGHTGTCNFTVTVNDSEAPSVLCANIFVPCNIAPLVPVAYPLPTVSDNCDAAPSLVYSIPSGSLFPVGTTPVTVQAIDTSGNQSQCTFTVTRAPLNFTGFFPPLGGADIAGGSFGNPVRSFRLNSTIPIKFTVSCESSPVLSGIHTLQAVKWSDDTTADPPIDATPSDSATSGNQFRLTDGEWHFNLDTKATALSVGKWQLIATLSDGTQHSAWIQIK